MTMNHQLSLHTPLPSQKVTLTVSLGEIKLSIDVIMAEATSFISSCYGSTVKTNMSAVQFDVWSSKMANRNISKSPKLKNLPPTTEAFMLHLKRVHFQFII
jgi:hypothetical protein